MLPVHVLLGKALLEQDQPVPAEAALAEALRLGVSREEVVVPLARATIGLGKPRVVLEDPRFSDKDLSPGTRFDLLMLKARAADDLGDDRLAMQQVELTAGGTKELTFSPGAADGVLRATVWNAAGKPLAERLVFRQPAHAVQVQIVSDAKQYVPGSPAKLTVKTSDETGKPISAVVGITVTDESVLEMIDKREQAPRLPVMVLLEGEVKELADAHVYLDPANDRAPTAVDLLLGTQGWRRFAFVDSAKFVTDHRDAARRPHRDWPHAAEGHRSRLGHEHRDRGHRQPGLAVLVGHDRRAAHLDHRQADRQSQVGPGGHRHGAHAPDRTDQAPARHPPRGGDSSAARPMADPRPVRTVDAWLPRTSHQTRSP